jgi:hypothetical protein
MSLFVFIDYIYIILIALYLMLFVLFIYFLPFTLYFKKHKTKKCKKKNNFEQLFIRKSSQNIFKFLNFFKKIKCLNFYSSLYYKSNITNNFFRLNKLYLKSKITKIIPYCKSIVIFCLCINIITINLLSLTYYSISINYNYIISLLIFFIFLKALIYFFKKIN